MNESGQRDIPSADAAGEWVGWDLDALDGDAVRNAYDGIATFVAWLRSCDIAVPDCWYTHCWVVWRLAALSAWQELAYLPGTSPREAVDWWLVGLEPLRRDWDELLAHRGKHVSPDTPLDDPQPVPPLGDVVDAVVAERRCAEEGP
jgi:hypothetical protein